MKIAFSSSDGERINQPVAPSASFWIWEVDALRARCVKKVMVTPAGRGPDAKIVACTEAVRDCSIVYATQIGNPTAARLVARRILPMRTKSEMPIAVAVERLQTVMNDNPPPWMRKALGMRRDVSRCVQVEE